MAQARSPQVALVALAALAVVAALNGLDLGGADSSWTLARQLAYLPIIAVAWWLGRTRDVSGRGVAALITVLVALSVGLWFIGGAGWAATVVVYAGLAVVTPWSIAQALRRRTLLAEALRGEVEQAQQTREAYAELARVAAGAELARDDPGDDAAMIRIVIADDDALARTGLAAILSSSPLIEVVGEAGDGAAAVAACGELRPDLVLLDLAMPGGGLEAAARIRTELPACAIVLMTTVDRDTQVRAALDAGYSFVLKASGPDELTGAVVAAAGTVYISPRITSRLVERTLLAAPEPDLLHALTPREREVLRLIASGESNHGIGRTLHLSEGTVKVHVKAILRKLAVGNRVQAAVLAHRSGLV